MAGCEKETQSAMVVACNSIAQGKEAVNQKVGI